MKKRTPLRRHPELIPYSREHHQVLLTAQLLKTDVPNYRGMPDTPVGKRTYVQIFLAELLEPHMQREETELFNRANTHPDLTEWINELRADHAFFRQEIPALNDLSDEDLVAAMNRLGQRLEQHVRLEERSFFQKYQMLFLKD